MVLYALEQQTYLGWPEFIQGYHHIIWEQIQRKYLSNKNLGSTAPSAVEWSKKTIMILSDYANEVWKIRNQAVHGPHGATSRKKRLDELKTKVIALYAHSSKEPSPAVRKMFKVPLEKRLRRGITNLTEWYSLTQRVIQQEKQRKGPRQITLQQAWTNHRQKFCDVHMFQNTIQGSLGDSQDE